MKKLIAFDLDGTLAESKSPLEDEMAELLGRLLQKYQVCVISGGKFEQFQKQLINNLHIDPALFASLHIMPTCGTRYLRFDSKIESWSEVYAENIPQGDKQRIVDALIQAVQQLGYYEERVYGERIEDRGSQITFSALGQDIVEHLGSDGVQKKEAWDPDNAKKQAIRQYVADMLPDYEVRVGGATSIDITRPGIDKAYGMNKLKEMLDFTNDDILFLGDKLEPGGNDYPVKEMGIDTIAVRSWRDTAFALRGVLAVS